MITTAAYSDYARSGFADGANYDQHRPSFPEESVDTLLKAVRVGGVIGAKIIDVGAGTGKFTEILARRHENFQIVAVEPHEGMRSVLQAKDLKNVNVMEGLSNRIPVEDQSFDAVIVAQVRHERIARAPQTSQHLATPYLCSALADCCTSFAILPNLCEIETHTFAVLAF